jgi:cell division protein ZapA (FtsZ GTPase activity inhibitor)
MFNYQSKAIDALKRGVILGTNTRLDLLDEQDRRRHESMLEKIAMRSALVTRRITKTSTKLLK